MFDGRYFGAGCGLALAGMILLCSCSQRAISDLAIPEAAGVTAALSKELEKSSKPGARKISARAPEGPVFDVRAFGAKGTDTGDDTAAIRRAIRSAEKAGGGVVFFPAGTYRVAPSVKDPQWSKHQPFVFAVNGSNIAFRGEGMKRSVISLYTAGMKDPNRNWTVIGDGKGYFKIKRGGLFRLAEGRAVRNVSFEGLRFSGNCRRSGSTVVGGDPGTGAGWDMSHKAIASFGDARVIVVRGCQFDGWRGEILYGGGWGVKEVHVLESVFRDCDANAVNMPDAFVRGCEIWNCNNGMEIPGFKGTPATVVDTKISGCENGIVYVGDRSGSLRVENCTVAHTTRAFFFANIAHNVTLRGNTVRDVEKFVMAIDHGDYKKERVGSEGFSRFTIEGNRIEGVPGRGDCLIYWQRDERSPLVDWKITGNSARGGNWRYFVKEFYAGEAPADRGVVIGKNDLPPGITTYVLDPSSRGKPRAPEIR